MQRNDGLHLDWQQIDTLYNEFMSDGQTQASASNTRFV